MNNYRPVDILDCVVACCQQLIIAVKDNPSCVSDRLALATTLLAIQNIIAVIYILFRLMERISILKWLKKLRI